MKKLISVFLICTLLISATGIIPVQAEYKRLPFTDLLYEQNSGYLNVENLYNRGIINGKSDTLFAPKDYLTREEVAKIIVLATGKTLVDKKGTFTDVKSGSWYEPYVETAAANDIVKGIGDGKFGVSERISRQDAVVLIGRMAEAMGIELVEMTPFSIADKSDISEYALNYAQVLVNMNAVDLDNNKKLLPKESITRLDFCKYLDRVLISDKRAYDDIIQSWMPQVKDINKLDSLTLAKEDFENGLTGFVDSRQGYPSKPLDSRLVTNMGKDSNKCIKITKGNDFNLFFNNIKAGTVYFLAYDIKVEGIDGADSFHRINTVWETPSGTVGANYARQNDIGGTTDWIRQTCQVAAPTPDLNPQALRLYFSVRGENQGAAYIDNLEIYEIVYEPVITYLKAPAFKGLITNPNGESDIYITSYITGMGSIYTPEKTKLVNTISDLNGNVLMKEEVVAPEEEMDITFSSKSLAIGDYDLCSALVDVDSGKIYGENHYMIRKRASDFKTKYNFDEYGRLTKDGKPWFVMSTYAYGNQLEDLNDFKDTNIDVILANSISRFYNNYSLLDEWDKTDVKFMIRLDSMLSNGIRTDIQYGDITTIASERAAIERMIDSLDFKNRECFFGYQLNNESPALQWGERMGWTNQFLAEYDFDHLVFGVSDGNKDTMKENSRMQDIYACDSPYPIYGRENDPIWDVWNKSKAVADNAYGRPMWTILQCYHHKTMGRAPYNTATKDPSEEEMRNMAWQAVCAGAQGIGWYAHFMLDKETADRPKSETFPEYMRVTDEVHEFEDVILSREDTPDIYQKATREDRFAWTVRRYNGKTYVFLVNSDKQPQTVSVKLENATSVIGVYGNKQYPVTDDGYIDVKLDGLGVEILVVDQPEPKSADCSLKTASFSSGDKNYFVSIVEDGSNTLRAEGAQEITYNLKVHKDATVKLNGETVSAKGSVSLSGVDKLTFTVTSDDGKHKKDYVYNVVK